MIRGRKPKPTLLREIQGNPGKRPLNRNEPQPGELMAPPADLCEVARSKWFDQIRLECWGLMVTAADADMLEQYCRLHAELKKAEAKVAEYGELVKSPNGFPCLSPWLCIVNKRRSEMRKIAGEFGGMPSSRTRLSVEGHQPVASKFGDLIA